MMIDVLIVGAGAAGLAAAIKAHDLGATVLLVDRDEFPGGILRQCIHTGFGVDYYNEELTGPEYLHRLLNEVKKRQIEIELNTTVLSIGDGTRARLLSSTKGLYEISCKATLLATGSYERTRENLTIPGARPAGVFTAGQTQQLINLHGLRIGSRVVVQGTGDIGLIITRRLILEGYEVAGVYERLPFVAGLRRNRAQCLDDFELDPRFSRQIVEIHGSSRVTGVTTASVDKQEPDAVIPGTEEYTQCDTVILSAGLIPNTELIANISDEGVDENLRVKGNAVWLAGNALEIHDLADGASKQAEVAASNAVGFIKGRTSIGTMPATFGDTRYHPGQYVSRWSVRDAEPTKRNSDETVCIVCPRGCVLTDNDYGCRRGREFLEQERQRRTRTLTTTVWAKTDSGFQRFALRSESPIPLDEAKSRVTAIKTATILSSCYRTSEIGEYHEQ